MKLSNILKNIPFESSNWIDLEIQDVSIDSRSTKPKDIFIAWKGVKVDSYAFIPNAIKNGAVAIVTEKKMDVDSHIPQIIVSSSREAYSQMMQNFFGCPADHFRLIGVTGTTGKTTIAFLIYSILNELNRKTGLIGTAGYYIGKHKIEEIGKGPITTPEPTELNRLFRKMKDNFCEIVVMEVSSFGLDQKRVFGLSFDQAILSNLSYNHHINYHNGIKNYIMAKELLFDQVKPSGIAIINVDTEYFDSFRSNAVKNVRIGKNGPVDYQISKVSSDNNKGTSFQLIHQGEIYQIDSPLVGDFQAYNASIAFVSCVNMGLNPIDVCHAIKKIASIPGRWQYIKTNLPFSVLVDKANTPIALKGILPFLQKTVYRSRILVFGNVGGGDSIERRMMARMFYNAFDTIVLTTDDPEDEEPIDGVTDFLGGIPGYDKSRIFVELDRRKAIKLALTKASENDLVAILGRGNQKEFLTKNKILEFDDIIVTKELVTELENVT